MAAILFALFLFVGQGSPVIVYFIHLNNTLPYELHYKTLDRPWKTDQAGDSHQEL